jgi:hypothetical protein
VVSYDADNDDLEYDGWQMHQMDFQQVPHLFGGAPSSSSSESGNDSKREHVPTWEERREARHKSDAKLTCTQRKKVRAARRADRASRETQRQAREAMDPENQSSSCDPPAFVPMWMRDQMRDDARRRRELRRADAQGVDPDHSDWKLYCDRQGVDSTLDAAEVRLAQSGQCTPAELRMEKLHRAHKYLKRHEQTCLLLQCQRNRRPNYLKDKAQLDHQVWLRQRAIRRKLRDDELAAIHLAEDRATAIEDSALIKSLIARGEFSPDDAEDEFEMQVEPPLTEKEKRERHQRQRKRRKRKKNRNRKRTSGAANTKRRAESSSSDDTEDSDTSTDEDAFIPGTHANGKPDDDDDANGTLVQEPGPPSTENKSEVDGAIAPGGNDANKGTQHSTFGASPAEPIEPEPADEPEHMHLHHHMQLKQHELALQTNFPYLRPGNNSLVLLQGGKDVQTMIRSKCDLSRWPVEKVLDLFNFENDPRKRLRARVGKPAPAKCPKGKLKPVFLMLEHRKHLIRRMVPKTHNAIERARTRKRVNRRTNRICC